MPTKAFSKCVLNWFDQHGRKNLPWQKPITPYRVWVSEIMLQQTQVETVIPYFERFMARFPNLKSLAKAPIDDVLHLWTGLGYYARARNLHKCAQLLVDEYKAEFPADAELLAQLPGIGRSTAAAITSIAYNKADAILDGNVKRVLARHNAIAGWPGQSSVLKELWQAAEQHMPNTRCRDYTQAMMDLGATLCTRSKPQCQSCPIAKDCKALATNTVQDYPGKKPKKDKPSKSVILLMLQNPVGELMLQQRPATGIWGGLWSFPELSLDEDLTGYIATHYGATKNIHQWPSWRHTFSHYHLHIHPVLAELKRKPRRIMDDSAHLWYNPTQPENLGLAAPVKRLLEQFHQHPSQQSIAY